MRRLFFITCVSAIALAACRPGRARPGALAPGACAIAAGPPAPAPVVTVSLPGPVDPAHAPVPRDAAERIVFRHLYETLVRLDCDGTPRPALAAAWDADEPRRRWTLTLRAGARFWDGAPVTARDVVAGWAARGVADRIGAAAVGEYTVRVTIRDPNGLRLLGDPGFAVAKAGPGGEWPIGTGPWWVTAATAAPESIAATPQVEGAPRLSFRRLARDPRDALDAGADILTTFDRSAIEYAEGHPQLVTAPLPFTLAYALILPGSGVAPQVDADDLARAAVRAEARALRDGGWWGEIGACPDRAAAPPPVAPGSGRLVYDRTDPVARDLAARLVATGAGPRAAAGVPPDQLGAAIAAGGEAGFVVALPARAADPCRAAAVYLPPYEARVVPLVETRPRAIVRRGVSGVVIEWDGTARILPP